MANPENLRGYFETFIMLMCFEGKGKRVFLLRKLRFFIDDKQKIITYKSTDGSLCF
jgi:hypothetical protein